MSAQKHLLQDAKIGSSWTTAGGKRVVLEKLLEHTHFEYRFSHGCVDVDGYTSLALGLINKMDVDNVVAESAN